MNRISDVGLILFLLFPSVLYATFSENPLITIPGGKFLLRSDLNPQKIEQVIQIKEFRILKFEVSNQLYRQFVQTSEHRPSFFDQHFKLGEADHPVVGVSWEDANAFCRFYGMKLPNEVQWEYAARGSQGRLYAWGNQPPAKYLVNAGTAECCTPSEEDGYLGTAPVDSFPQGQTPEGVFHMTGNVWEWIDGWYIPDQSQSELSKRFRILRGGSWNSGIKKLKTTYRLIYNGDFRFSATGGFRCISE